MKLHYSPSSPPSLLLHLLLAAAAFSSLAPSPSHSFVLPPDGVPSAPPVRPSCGPTTRSSRTSNVRPPRKFLSTSKLCASSSSNANNDGNSDNNNRGAARRHNIGRSSNKRPTTPYERYDQIRTKMKDRLWYEMLALLGRYHEERASGVGVDEVLDVPYNYWCRLDGMHDGLKNDDLSTDRDQDDDESLVNLGKWVREQRRAHNEGTLAGWKVDELDGLGVNWLGRRDADADTGVGGWHDAYTITVSRHLKDACMDYVRWKRSYSAFLGQDCGAARSLDSWLSVTLLVTQQPQRRRRRGVVVDEEGVEVGEEGEQLVVPVDRNGARRRRRARETRRRGRGRRGSDKYMNLDGVLRWDIIREGWYADYQ